MNFEKEIMDDAKDFYKIIITNEYKMEKYQILKHISKTIMSDETKNKYIERINEINKIIQNL